MNASKTIVSLSLASLTLCMPLIASAQTADTPGGQASTGTPIEQKPGKAASPGSTATTPSATNPSGSLSKGHSMTPNADTTMTNKSGMSKSGKATTDKSNKTEPGDVPTYPAPARDGTPTK